MGLVTSFPARLGKWTLGRWDKGLVEVGGAAVKIGLKLVNIFVTFFLGRKCGDFSRRFGWGREFSREWLGSKLDEEKGVYKGRAREWPGRPIDGRRSDNNFCQVMLMRANQRMAAESGERRAVLGVERRARTSLRRGYGAAGSEKRRLAVGSR